MPSLPSASTLTRRFFYTHGNIFCVTHDDGTVSSRSDCPASLGASISPRLDESFGYDDLDRLSGYHAYAASAQTDSGQWTYDGLDRVSSEQETHALGSVNRTTSFDYLGLSSDAAKETWTGSGGRWLTTFLPRCRPTGVLRTRSRARPRRKLPRRTENR